MRLKAYDHFKVFIEFIYQYHFCLFSFSEQISELDMLSKRL